MLSKTKFIALVALPLFCGAGTMAVAAPGDQPTPANAPEHHFDAAAHHKMACTYGYATHAARLAFVEAALDLTEPQRAAFAKWRTAVLDGAAKDKVACLEAAPKPDWHPNLVEAQTKAEKSLALKLQALQASHPALQAFYESLTPAQRMEFDHMHQMGGHMHGGGGHDGDEHGGWGHGDDHMGPPHGGDGPGNGHG
jgi:hypothetical protein